MDDHDHWPECESCDRTFGSQRACDQHMNDTNHWAPRFECETCTKEFRSENAANQHMRDVVHWAPKIPCQTCGKRFHTQNAVNQHMDALGHWAPKIPCETCGRKFHTQDAVHQHMREQAHYKNYCKRCGLGFQNKNNLQMHLTSKVHRGTNVLCPFCKVGYTSASGLTHHFETGACPHAPKLNRDTILNMIRQRDPHGVITNKQIEWHKEKDFKYSVTNRAFNGSYWECYICHDEFSTKPALNAHINSPVHKQKVYRCPNSTKECGKQFVTLAGLFNHLESEACAFMRFEKVQQQVKCVLQGSKLITFS
ncbi:hypothetical protein BDW02DRAFT_511913 [Decorospora gaudefroyi]|uniref:C2H2-type domain-containing protein n=1 Tax=Decorospora gaudefroyi TaxID=184978 RepID=A0A6A5K2D4_9PLEO|nr:hypothetical protein BDW02DRAFT_511913 [Decorospora gaudefroyi]